MQPLSAIDLLAVWERGQAQTSTERALTLLAAAAPATSLGDLATLPIGQRDAHLLTLREWAFGSHLRCVAQCPACDERLELALDVADIRIGPEQTAATMLTLNVDDYDMLFRLPNSRDLAAIATHIEPDAARRALLERCVERAMRGNTEVACSALPEHVTRALVQRMAEADPQAEIQLALVCPACAHQWQMTFDIVAFFWDEINAWANRMLREVHTLASAYGWRETDILLMSAWRRQRYLELVSG